MAQHPNNSIELIFGSHVNPSFEQILCSYTSMCAYMMAAWWERKVSMATCLRMWVLSWLWNFVGCAIFVGLMYASNLYHHKDWYIKLLAVKKVSNSWGVTLVQGIFANW
jgi:formate/nitrite transporter FocA (FNT family)